MHPNSDHRPSPVYGRISSKRASLLIVAMLLAAVIGISLVSYINLATTTLRTADRSFYANASVGLAESGVEHAMACFYQVATGTAADTAWNGWIVSGSNVTRTFNGFTPGPNSTGVVRVFASNYTMGTTPVIVAMSTISPPSGGPIEKFLEITLSPRGLFSMGMVAKETITVNGDNARFDSWNSDPDFNSGTAPIAYSAGVRTPNCTVATNSSAAGAIDMGNSDIFGTVHTGDNGTISDNPNAVVSGSFSGSGVDETRVSDDFAGTFPAITVPSPAIMNFVVASPGNGTSFPRVGDGTASDGKYYYTFGIGTSLSVSGTNSITVAGNCVFIFSSHSGVTSISTSGNGAVVINNNASLVVYTNGNIASSGTGFVNNNLQPEKCLFYGTNPTNQTVSITGNGSGGAAYYMPNANFTITGNGDVRGAIVANRIAVTGNAAFHYDQALARIGGSAGLRVTKWKELRTATERQTYATQLNF